MGFTTLECGIFLSEIFLGEILLLALFFQQLILFVFNLLVPAYPLDGGRIFANILLHFYDVKTCAKIIVFVSVPIGVGIAIYGGIESWMLTLLVGAYILYQSWVLWQHLSDNSLHKHPLFSSEHALQHQQPPPSLASQAERQPSTSL